MHATAADRYLSKTTVRRCRQFCAAAPILICGTATLALLGWFTQFEVAKSFSGGSLTPMNPLTAIAFILAAVGLLGLRADTKTSRVLVRMTSVILIAIGLWRTLAYLTPIDMQVDYFLSSKYAGQPSMPNRMAFTTAVAFALLGVALGFVNQGSYRRVTVGQVSALGVSSIGLTTVVSYAYGISAMLRPDSQVPMAVNTGILFLLGGLAIIASRPDAGFMTEFASQHFPGVAARRLLVGAVTVPMAVGWLRIAGESAGLYSAETGVALMAVFTIVSMVALIWSAARSLESIDGARRAAAAQVRALTDELTRQNAELEQKVAERTRSLEESQREILERLARAAAYRDDETGKHTHRMSTYTYLIARAAGLSASESELLRDASKLHDLGKIGIPDAILLKPGKLTPEEFEVIKQHPGIGADLLSGGSTELVRAAEAIALTHHERWDGTGYPRGLRGTEIPLYGRIVAVADVLDALTSSRPYKRAWRLDEAIAEIVRQSGKMFDPEVVQAMLDVLPEIELVTPRIGDDDLTATPGDAQT